VRYNNRGLVRREQGDVVGALADYDQAIALKPDDATAYNDRGIMRREQGDLAGALADYEQYLELGGGMQYGNQKEVEHDIRTLRAQLPSKGFWRNFLR